MENFCDLYQECDYVKYCPENKELCSHYNIHEAWERGYAAGINTDRTSTHRLMKAIEVVCSQEQQDKISAIWGCELDENGNEWEEVKQPEEMSDEEIIEWEKKTFANGFPRQYQIDDE